jgi:NosR/NirI family nitrous oxide reductase transcriptional regulator
MASAHVLRVAAFAAILLLIHLHHQKLSARSRADALQSIPIETARRYFPDAAEWGPATTLGGRTVLDASGSELGQVLQTSPASDREIGFSGPTNTLIAVSTDSTIVGAQILNSADTRDHVHAVAANEAFWNQLKEKSLDSLSDQLDLDGVSGATLTSISIQRGIQKRFGARTIAGKFPDPPPLSAVQILFPDADELSGPEGALWTVRRQGAAIGSILRNSPAADDIVGYQGPTDALIGLSPEGTIVGVVLGKTYDNEEYVSYVRGDEYFRDFWNGRSLAQLSTVNFEQEGVEGVSGATMTSIAVVRGLIAAAKAATSPRPGTPGRGAGGEGPDGQSTSLPWRLLGTIACITLGAIVGLTHLRGVRWIRTTFHAVLFIYFGLISGQLLSQAMLVGWAQNGVPWTGATSLVLLSIAAFALPIVSRQNVYCSHICPHGILQQWIRPAPRRAVRVRPAAARLLATIRPILLAVVIAGALFRLPINLVDLEPFDAYLWQTAGWAAIAIAVIGLAASAFVPMAYCRFGCPTGAVLDYVRLHGRADRLSSRDAFAAVCLMLAVGAWLWG